MSKLQGGKFGHGFAAAGVVEVFSPAITTRLKDQPFKQFVVATVLGGTASRVSGGKFANGAVTAAFVYGVSQGYLGAYRKGGSGSRGAAASRGLTEDEVRLVQDYYGEDVPYEDIRVSLKKRFLPRV